MTNELKNVPELRFPEFDGEWEEKNLEEVSNKVTEKNRSNELSETFTNSAEYGIISQQDYFDKAISNEKNLSNYYIVKKDDFVYNPRISNFAPVGPIKRNKLNRSGLMSPLYYVFRTFNINMDYIGTYFETIYWHKFMKLNGDSGARSDRFAIKDSVFQTMPIPYPIIEEQQKIGEFFSKLDRQIELEEQKLEKLEEQKKGYMQKIFSQQLGFKDENGNEYPTWQSYKLGNLYKKGKAGGTPKSTESKYYNGEVPFLSISDITEQGKFIMNTEKSITQEGVDNSTAWLVPVNSINYAMYASVGYLSINKIEVATSQAIFNMVFEDNNLVEYIYYYLNHIRDKGILEKLVGTGTQSNLSASIMKSMYIKLPDYEEMVKITDFLSKVDKLIEKQNQKIDGLKERKKGFLQKMFV
ncbi:restriction endonuclease subunit S [Mammaliicoccus sp. M-M49]|uniref:restriction endonuclease subunit S n=1 Tax=Mammaliicoccus sp. M-M49 TaxID=2898708 RepID=UPI001EFB7197|nr:restriction endonuclease subunit S [Mammaliicoccus sp. M-M49]